MPSNDQTNKIDENKNYSVIVDKIIEDILNMRSNEKQEILSYLEEQIQHHKKFLVEYPEGIAQLGNCYDNEIGTSIDREKAFELYRKAANLGSIPGIGNLAYCYQYGIGTDISEHKAFELYQKAANLGYDIAQCRLAYMFEIGDGIDKDMDKAYHWYKKSAEQGNRDAQNKLKDLRLGRNIVHVK
ncbi:unnamed protein product [Rhizophagus irregularis]|nr:unnamed protein product [Rhizophagus irregularis]